jgi:hypothetical protein
MLIHKFLEINILQILKIYQDLYYLQCLLHINILKLKLKKNNKIFINLLM